MSSHQEIWILSVEIWIPTECWHNIKLVFIDVTKLLKFSQISFSTCKFLHAWLTVSFCLLNSWNRDKQTFVQWRHSSTLEWQVQYRSSSSPYILIVFSLQLGFRGRNLVKGVKIRSIEHSRSISKNKSVKIFIKWKTGFLKKLTAEDENQERGWSISLNLEANTLHNWPKSEWFFVLWVNKIVNILFREFIEFGCSLNNIQIILNQLELFHAQTP